MPLRPLSSRPSCSICQQQFLPSRVYFVVSHTAGLTLFSSQSHLLDSKLKKKLKPECTDNFDLNIYRYFILTCKAITDLVPHVRERTFALTRPQFVEVFWAPWADWKPDCCRQVPAPAKLTSPEAAGAREEQEGNGWWKTSNNASQWWGGRCTEEDTVRSQE